MTVQNVSILTFENHDERYRVEVDDDNLVVIVNMDDDDAAWMLTADEAEELAAALSAQAKIARSKI